MFRCVRKLTQKFGTRRGVEKEMLDADRGAYGRPSPILSHDLATFEPHLHPKLFAFVARAQGKLADRSNAIECFTTEAKSGDSFEIVGGL